LISNSISLKKNKRAQTLVPMKYTRETSNHEEKMNTSSKNMQN
jgi:hypothetical protein